MHDLKSFIRNSCANTRIQTLNLDIEQKRGKTNLWDEFSSYNFVTSNSATSNENDSSSSRVNGLHTEGGRQSEEQSKYYLTPQGLAYR